MSNVHQLHAPEETITLTREELARSMNDAYDQGSRDAYRAVANVAARMSDHLGVSS